MLYQAPAPTRRRRTVILTWVPVTDATGHTTMEMRWHVENCPPVVTEYRTAA